MPGERHGPVCVRPSSSIADVHHPPRGAKRPSCEPCAAGEGSAGRRVHAQASLRSLRKCLTGPAGCGASRPRSGTALLDKAPFDCRNRKSAMSPASRARCLKPAPHDPRWTDLSGAFAHAKRAYPPLFGATACLAVGTAVRHATDKPPGDARLAHRDRVASAAAARVCVLHPAATTAPDPHHPRRLRKAPPWIEARALSGRISQRG